MKKAVYFIKTLLHGVFPSVCIICNEELPPNMNHICPFCKKKLPVDHLATNEKENKILELFFGRVQLDHAFCQYAFEKDSKVQHLLHQIKYKDKSDLAKWMGQKIGESLMRTSWFDSVDVLLPVPIHPHKKFIRGYNQSEMLAKGISEHTKKQMNTDLLERKRHQESQTKQGRFNRWDNLQNTFKTKATSEHYNHVAIVDDVVTTGATIEKIVINLRQKNPNLRISIITLAVAK
jgi:ComF family protein